MQLEQRVELRRQRTDKEGASERLRKENKDKKARYKAAEQASSEKKRREPQINEVHIVGVTYLVNEGLGFIESCPLCVPNSKRTSLLGWPPPSKTRQ